MPLTPLDIHNKEFRRSFRGYNEGEVDEFLDEVVRDYDAILKENANLKRQVAELRESLEHYRNLEATLNKTLTLAQETADELKENARKEAEMIIREAESKADTIIKQAEAKTQKLIDSYERLKSQIQVVRSKLKSMMLAHIELIDRQVEEMEVDLPPDEETKIVHLAEE